MVAQVAARDEVRRNVTELSQVLSARLDGRDASLVRCFDKGHEVVDRKEGAANIVLEDRLLEHVVVAVTVWTLHTRGMHARSISRNRESSASHAASSRHCLECQPTRNRTRGRQTAEEGANIVGVKKGGVGSAAQMHAERRQDTALLLNATPMGMRETGVENAQMSR